MATEDRVRTSVINYLITLFTAAMTTLIVGFDSAWTAHNQGAIVGLMKREDGSYFELGQPKTANFNVAEETISDWEKEHDPDLILITLDQPTIVKNKDRQRDVENIVASPVSLRYGGVQPANTDRKGMFDESAPVWSFLNKFGGAANPLELKTHGVHVFETYPVLSMIALDWVLPDKSRQTGRLPKYNPSRKATFRQEDWNYDAKRMYDSLRSHSLTEICSWLATVIDLNPPSKADQDKLDACLCLLSGIHLAEQNECLMVGNLSSGYMVIPHSPCLYAELKSRCAATSRDVDNWVNIFRLFHAP